MMSKKARTKSIVTAHERDSRRADQVVALNQRNRATTARSVAVSGDSWRVTDNIIGNALISPRTIVKRAPEISFDSNFSISFAVEPLRGISGLGGRSAGR